jgi:hypothetical protein
VSGLSNYIRLFHANTWQFRQIAQLRLQGVVPNARVPQLIEKKTAVSLVAVVAIIELTERWQIIDRRIEIFRTALGVASYNIDAAWHPYFDVALRRMPRDFPGQVQQGTPLTWEPPDDQGMQELERVGNDLIDALADLESYIYDLRIEMQNLLVGELFDQTLPPRQPVDPRITIVLDRHKELAAYFNKDTAWGRDKARIEAEVRTVRRPGH